MKWAGHVVRMGDEQLVKRAEAQKVEGKEGEEHRECIRRTALREIRKEWEESGEQQQQLNGIGDY